MNIKKNFLVLSLFILGIAIMVTVFGEITYKRFIDSWFITSSLFTSVLLFKVVLDRGGFDVFRYSWHKTKKYVLFFLPKYWKSDEKDAGLINADGEKVKIDSIYDFVEYRKSKIWKNMPILLVTSFTHLAITIVLSLLIYFY